MSAIVSALPGSPKVLKVAIGLRDPKFVVLPNGDLDGEIDATEQRLGVQITGAVRRRIGGAK
jgi:hypothetical protein